MSRAIVGTYTFVRQLRKRVPLRGPGEGFTTEPYGQELVTVRLEIDAEALAKQMGTDACRNKNKESRRAAGVIRARILKQELVGVGAVLSERGAS